ncbi:calnexin-like [Phlebotomus argentipes]|uniref:calnexin-like n=1 Tax=Phlebotomus argentipes TaxID=94469 RepID=UPI002892C749|nr:calnexin-like [Phlebotomus argentipes]XP_059616200.1 calnexin-like [Phlebotomus argentipes]
MRRATVALLAIGLLLVSGQATDDAFDDDVVVSTEDDSTPVDDDDSIQYESPKVIPGKFYFAEHFDDEDAFGKKWVKSQAKKDNTADEIAKYDGVWEVETPQRPILKQDLGLVLKSKAKHAAIASRLMKPFVFTDKPLVVQYEVTLQEGQECGGAYIKLLSAGKETNDLSQFQDKTPYTIMFGPDKCGNDIKLHFIFRHVNPLNGTITEKHCRKSKDRIEEPFRDKQPHLYQLLLRPDNTFEIRVDHNVVNEGSLLADFTPSVNPPREIDDPTDVKPTDWDEREKIPDPDTQKPADWDEDAPPQIPDPNAMKPEGWLDDEEEMISDSNAVKPDDWDTDMDGEWEAPLVPNPVCEKAVGCGVWKAPLIQNPNYKGKWRAPLIDNPNYQGKWAPKKIPNPDFFEDLRPFRMTTIAAVGIELWSMSSDILFDNIIITDDAAAADQWAAQTYDLKRKQIDREAETLVTRLVNYTNENPWMWGVYVVVVGLPLSIAIFFLCSSSKDKSIPDAARSKKTDEPVPDDLIGDGPQARSKSDLDEPTPLNTQGSQPHGEGDNKGAGGDGVNNSPGDEPAEEAEAEAEEEQAEGGGEEDDDDGEIINAKESRGTESEDEGELDVPARTESVTASVAASEGTRKRKPRRE